MIVEVKPKYENELIIRTLSAMVLIPLALSMVYLGGWWFTTFVGFIAYRMAFEWERMWGRGSKAFLYFNLAVVMPVLALTNLGMTREAQGILWAGLVFYLLRPPFMPRPTGWQPLGLLYVAVPTSIMVWWGGFNHAGAFVIAVLVCVWLTDIGAYFAGRAIGGPKLAPSISPKKTWAGLIGGMGLASIVAYVSYAKYVCHSFTECPQVDWGIKEAFFMGAIAAITAAVSQMGDLFESWMKRKAGVKDSGNLIPGHGGVLDRVDGLVFALPFATLCYYIFFGHFEFLR